MNKRTNFQIKFALLENGLTARDLCQTLGLNETFFSNIVGGRVNPSDELQLRIAKALKVGASELF